MTLRRGFMCYCDISAMEDACFEVVRPTMRGYLISHFSFFLKLITSQLFIASSHLVTWRSSDAIWLLWFTAGVSTHVPAFPLHLTLPVLGHPFNVVFLVLSIRMNAPLDCYLLFEGEENFWTAFGFKDLFSMWVCRFSFLHGEILLYCGMK